MTGNLPPPHDRDAERSLVANLLEHPERLADAIDYVSGAEFYDRTMREVFEAIVRVTDSNTVVDLPSVNAEIRRAGKSDIAPSTALAELVLEPSGDVTQCARRIRSRARQRAMLAALAKLVVDGRAESTDPDGWVERVQAEVFELAQRTEPCPPEDIAETTRKTLEVLQERQRGDLDYVPTTLCTLNYRVHGWIAGLQVVAARPGIGKTSFALQEAVNFGLRDMLVVFASLEMDRQELTERLLSQLGEVDNADMMSGRLEPSQWSDLTGAAERIRSLPIGIIDDSTLTVAQLRAKVRREVARLRRKHGDLPFGAIIVDYLQLMTGEGQTREQAVASVSRGLAALAKDFGVPLIALSQLNRGSTRENREPNLSDLRESGQIEQDAKRVVFIHNPDAALPANEQGTSRKLIVAKVRGGGSCGVADCAYDGPHTRFYVRAHESHDGIDFDNERPRGGLD